MDAFLTLLLNGSDSTWLDNVAWLATKVWVWIPLYVAILISIARRYNVRSTILIVVTLAVAVLVCDQVASSIVKPLVCRLRPTHDPALMNRIDIVNGYRGGMYGFFSSHAANTMAIATLTSLLLRKRMTTLALVAWSLINCWTRVYLGVHFVGDLIAGLLFGAIIGFCLYKILQKWGKVAITTNDAKVSTNEIRLTPSKFLDNYLILATLICVMLFVSIPRY